MGKLNWFDILLYTVGRVFGNSRGRSQRATKLRASEALYRTVVERGNDGIIIVQHGRIVYSNPQVTVALGYRLDEVQGQPIAQYIAPEDRAMVQEYHRRRLAGEQAPDRYAINLLGQDGRRMPVEISVTLIMYEGCAAVLAFIRDMTQQQQTLTALQRSEQQFRDMFHKHSAIMYLIDPETLRILDANHAAEQFYGYTCELLTGMYIPDLNTLSEDEIRNEIEAARQEGRTYFNFKHRLASGELRDVEVRSTPITLGDGQEVYFAIVHDITERKRAAQALRQRVEQLDALRTSLAEMSGNLELERLLQTILERATALLHASHGYLSLLDPERNELWVAMSSHPQYDFRGQRIATGPGVMGWVAQQYAPRVLADYHTWEGRLPFAGVCIDHAALAVPLLAGDILIGAIHVADTDPERRFQLADVELLTLFAQQAAIAIQNARLFAEVQQLATTDSLTGLYNRRHFFTLASHEFDLAVRYGHALSVIMLDVDNFKQVNDNYGHLAGDQVLCTVAHQCKSVLRVVDLVGRYGGEEIMVLMPQTDQGGARHVAERLRQQIAQTGIRVDNATLSVTVSLGIAACAVGEPTNLDTLIDRADQALYIAKQTGKNRVVLWQHENQAMVGGEREGVHRDGYGPTTSDPASFWD